MNLLKQPNRWSCMPTSFAMALGVSVEWIYKQIGHDGSEILYPDLPEPECRKCFHWQEMLDISYKLGYAVMLIEANPRHGPSEDRGIKTYKDPVQRLFEYMYKKIGVIGVITSKGNKHCVAWNGHEVYDPNGTIGSIKDYDLEYFWKIDKIRNIVQGVI